MLTAFWLLSFSLVITPGADWAYAISAGMRDKAIVPAIVGMLFGYLMITLVVATGVGALVASVPAILTVLTFLGAGYLLWLGGSILAHPSVPTVDDDQASGTWLGWVIRGFATSGGNAKALLLFLALLPQFTSRDGALVDLRTDRGNGPRAHCQLCPGLFPCQPRFEDRLAHSPEGCSPGQPVFRRGYDCYCPLPVDRAVFSIHGIALSYDLAIERE